tara:strand:+ start:1273 stop:1815 length:543 start_codon:yes stop_codon:yes gene_type:complete
MNVHDYIKYYNGAVPFVLCEDIINYPYNYKPSTYSNHKGKIDDSKERVRMDEYWVRKNYQYYDEIKSSFEWVIKKYSEEFSLFSVQNITDFRINKYPEGGFMSKHVDNIHHSHGQQYGFPQATILLYLNDDYEGGEFYVAEKEFKPEKGSAIIFPSNFMYPHEAKKITKGTRWSVVTWLM